MGHMKFLLADPSTGGQKTLEITDERMLMAFFGMRIAQDVDGACLGPEYEGYTFRITGGNDKQGFPMLQGVLSNLRSRLLFKKGMKTFRERRAGSRKRKSVRGCILEGDLSAVSLFVIKKGEQEIPGLTDDAKPRRLGPKRCSKVRKLFGLNKKDDVTRYVVRREVKKGTKAPKIQRLITKKTLQRKRRYKAIQKQHYTAAKVAKEEYMKLKAAAAEGRTQDVKRRKRKA
eukprot:NODE_2815_length_870_cov_280.309202.p1 GENE.NODE_2815_length_870_cov_280.309202~~NODE_2815_length_870_cov_280.309202.p1  ORF type:complete len:230 (+),score=77.46 NODE_2815_length_870_cov_280.309202:3-692(+)